MLEQLFEFPIIMIDVDNEQRKFDKSKKFGDMGLESEADKLGDYDMAKGKAMYPYWDFIGIEDRWLPTIESWENARAGKFEACIVKFVNVGTLLVPWTRRKFMEEIKKFISEYEANRPIKPSLKGITVRKIPLDKYDKLMEELDNGKDEE